MQIRGVRGEVTLMMMRWHRERGAKGGLREREEVLTDVERGGVNPWGAKRERGGVNPWGAKRERGGGANPWGAKRE